MAWSLGGKKEDISALLKQAEDAVIEYTAQITALSQEKDSYLKRQVEIWSVSTADTSAAFEAEYKNAASRVALDVKKVICLEEHIKKLKLALFHAKNGDATRLKEVLAVTDPCANVSADAEDVKYTASPSPAI